jgi:hypothetical protein
VNAEFEVKNPEKGTGRSDVVTIAIQTDFLAM